MMRFFMITTARSFEESFFTTKNAICKIGGTLHGRIINAEFSLQSTSHNSHKNNQQQSWSQIREI